MGRNVTETLAGTCMCQKYIYEQEQNVKKDTEYQTCKIPLQDTFGIFNPRTSSGISMVIGKLWILDGVQGVQKKIAHLFSHLTSTRNNSGRGFPIYLKIGVLRIP